MVKKFRCQKQSLLFKLNTLGSRYRYSTDNEGPLADSLLVQKIICTSYLVIGTLY